MKKVMIVLTAAVMLTACGNSVSTQATTNDSTAVKTDSTTVDTIKVDTTVTVK